MKEIERIVQCRYIADSDDKFQTKWFVKILNENNINVTGLANLLHITRVCSHYYVNGKRKVPFSVIVAVCYLLKLPDDPNEVYENIMKEA